ncbi:signal peptidase II [Amaricoccus sp.]|uniref:signal peptidase II n=1 Tax=Amaricoccus sp. TaxID=1872485 RepID=UPI0026336CE2|nr:signal peptidase II [Amaricoccus sp.]HRO12675.1 signal peptidase II [Amaricoccus sp.]
MPAGNIGRALLVAAVVFALDRALKLWVVVGLDLQHRLHIPVLDPWLNLTMAWNEGINFGLFDFGAAGRWVLVALALAIVAALLVWARHGGWVQAIGVGAIVGGALGNVWDRVRWGAVADFINMSCCGIRNPFAFNVADAAIFGGAALLVVAGARKGR